MKEYLFAFSSNPKSRITFCLVCVCHLLIAVCIIGQAYFLAKVIADVFLLHKTLSSECQSLVFLIVIALCRMCFATLVEYLAQKTSNLIKDSFRAKVMQNFFTQGIISTQHEQTGEIINTLTSGLDQLDGIFKQYLPQIFSVIAVPSLIIVTIFTQDWVTGTVLLLTVPLLPTFMLFIGSLAKAKTATQWQILSRLSANFMDTLQGLTTLKSLGRSKDYSSNIAQAADKFRIVTLSVLKIAFLSALVMELATTLSTAIVAVEIGLRLLNGKIPFQNALFVLILAPEFYLPFRALGSSFHAALNGKEALSRINKLLAINFSFADNALVSSSRISSKNILKVEENIIENASSNLLLPSDNILQIDALNFTYFPDTLPIKNVLQNFTLTLRQGHPAVIVGASGSGKSTLINLLLRYYSAQSGSVFLNNTNLSTVPLEIWRDQIAWLPQKPFLLPTTIAENLLIANPKASQAEIVLACEKAHIHNFIDNLPQKYATLLLEEGQNLSTGQIKRLALARIFLRNSPFIILDEPTTNIDPVSEKYILQSIAELVQNRISLQIIHKLSTINPSHLIHVLNEGKIVEAGYRADLLSQKGKFYSLTQAGAEDL